MKTIGQLFLDARHEKKYTLARVERLTKIKKEFIKGIEQQEWQLLPEYPVVLGFVKNISRALGVDESKAVAFLRRDYPPQKVAMNPKPDLPIRELRWSPRLTFLLGIAVVVIAILGYLGFQYLQFISPPRLEVIKPIENEIVRSTQITIKGETNPEATITINNQPALVNDSGDFEAEIEVSNDTKEIQVIATSRSGKQTQVSRKITPEIE